MLLIVYFSFNEKFLHYLRCSPCSIHPHINLLLARDIRFLLYEFFYYFYILFNVLIVIIFD